jgi:hypothetical protein
VHGGPGVYDHSCFKPDFALLTEHAQVVYLDLRGHGRSAWGQAAAWSFEACATTSAFSVTRPGSPGRSSSGTRWAARSSCSTGPPPGTHGRAHHPIRVRPVGPAADGRGFRRGRRGGRTDRAAQLRRREGARGAVGPCLCRLRPTAPRWARSARVGLVGLLRGVLAGCQVRECAGDGGGAAGDLQPLVDVFQVGAHGCLGQAEPPGDLGVGVPSRH